MERMVKVKMRVEMALIVWNFQCGGRVDCRVDERDTDLGEVEVSIPEEWVNILKSIKRSYVTVNVHGESMLDCKHFV